MPTPKNVNPQLTALAKRQQERLNAVIERRGVAHVNALYKDAAARVRSQLERMIKANKGEQFRAYQKRHILVQLERGIADISKMLRANLTSLAPDVATTAHDHLIEQLLYFVNKRKMQHEVPVEIAQALYGEASKRESLLRLIKEKRLPDLYSDLAPDMRDRLMARFKKASVKYGMDTIEAVERRMGLSIAAGDTFEEAVDAVAGVDGILPLRRYRSETIVRTEMANVYAQKHFEAAKDLQKALPAFRMKRMWLAVLDERTGEDSLAMHGQIRDLNEPFFNPVTGEDVMNPPERPNSRCRVMLFVPTDKET